TPGAAEPAVTQTYPARVIPSDPAPFDAVKVTVWSPGAAKTRVGPLAELSSVPSALKSHAHAVGPLVERSTNVTASGAAPVRGDPRKSAVGARVPPLTIVN